MRARIKGETAEQRQARLDRMRLYREENAVAIAEQERATQAGNSRWSWERNLCLRGLTVADYEAMVEAQEGCCALCGTDKPWARSDKWAVDHDHETGKVRGLLCHACNKALGLFKDNPVVMRRAAEYVERIEAVA